MTMSKAQFQQMKFTEAVNRVGWGKMSMVGQSRSLWKFISYAKIKRSSSLFCHSNRKSKIDDPFIISSLAFIQETETSSDLLCPIILILAHPTLSDYGMESDLTRGLQPCSANTYLIPDHKPNQLGMNSNVGDKEES